MSEETRIPRLSKLLLSSLLGLVLVLTLLFSFGCTSTSKAPVASPDVVAGPDDAIAPEAILAEEPPVDPLPEEPDGEAPPPQVSEPYPMEIDLFPMSPLAQRLEAPTGDRMLGRPATAVPVRSPAAPSAAPAGEGTGLAMPQGLSRQGSLQTAGLGEAAIASLQATDSFSEPYILLDKYDDYYGAAGVAITQVHGTFVDPNEAWSRYQAGDLDVIIPPEGEIDNIQATAPYSTELSIFPMPGTNYYGFSNDVPPLDNSLLRAALSAAIDRERLISDTLSGDEFPALTFSPPGVFGHVDGYAEGVGHPYSPATAQAYLATSGYTGSPTITLMFPNSPRDQAMAAAVRQMWIDTLGVTVTLESGGDDYFNLIVNGSAAERPGIFRLGWRADYPDANNFLSLFRSDEEWNFVRYNSSAFEAALDQAIAATDAPTRLSAYQEAESYLVMTDTAMAPLYYYPYYRMTVSDVVRSPGTWWGQHLDGWDFTGDGRPLRVGWGNLTTLDPALAYWETDLNYVEQLFLGLTDFDEEGNVSTELATGWDVSADGLVYTFTLRTDADWTDGNPVTAHDVEYGVLRTLGPETETPPDQPSYDYVLYVIENAQEYNNGNITDPEQVGVEALDDTHIVFTLTEPAAYFPSILAMPAAYPQPEWAITAHGDMWTAAGNIVTNGPFQLTEWVEASAVGVYKDAAGGGQTGEGGTALLRIVYWNDGGGVASGLVITDMMEGMTYITDTLGIPAVNTSPLVWEPDDLPGRSYNIFYVIAQVDATAGERITNTVEIETANPYDTGDQRMWMWSEEVWPNDTQLRVNKEAWTGDPAPGYESIHRIEVCNDGTTRSNEVVLTDTLHPSFTLQTWWSDSGWWTEVFSDGHELVLTHPTVENRSCDNIYMRVLLDPNAWRDMTVTDTVRIASSNDIETGDNESTWWGNVQLPYVNLRVDKGFAFGQPIPGGTIGYHIDYRNEGNVPVEETIRITDTLPVSTSFSWAFHWNPEGPIPVTPTLETDEYVVWEIDGLENGFGDNFIVIVDVDPGPGVPSSVLNTVEITEIPYERSYRDNVSEWSETVNVPGPNLRVRKSHQWWGWNNDQLYYEISVANVGTQTISSVLVTDVYPIDTTFTGWQWSDYWLNIDFYTTTSELVWELEELEPGNSTGIYFVVNVDHPGEPLHTYTNTVQVMTLPDEVNEIDNFYEDVAFSGGEVQHVDLNVYRNDLWGCAHSGPVTVTTAYTERVYYDSCWGDWFDDPFLPGDTVTVTAGGGQMPVIFTVPDPFIVNASSVTDTVWGQIDSLDEEPVEISLYDYMDFERQTDDSGNFSALFPDIPRAGRGEVRYRTYANYAQVTFHREFQTPDLVFTVDYDDDWINGNYEPGHTVWLTLTESNSATVKATAVVTTGPIPWWGGQSGFEASGDDWSPSNPDIVPGDWAFGLLHSNVYTTAVRVGAINGWVDPSADLVTGTLDIPWLVPELVTVNCEIHEENGQSIQVYDVYADGGTFSCDFSGGDNAYDIVPGTNVAINYVDPSGNRVQMHPANPAPYLRIEKQSDGTPGQGGNMGFRIRYRNDGGMSAPDVVITDTLEGMTYLFDTSPFAVTTTTVPGGEVIVFNLGTVDPTDRDGDWHEFTLFARVDEVAGNPVVNTAEIATSSPWDQGEPWEKVSSWDGMVWDNATNLWVNKNTWTWDPVVGTEFVYTLQACNGDVENNTNSSWTTLTDTLPMSTTLVTWWADDPGWVEVQSTDHLLVVQRPTVDANRCSQVYVQVSLDTGQPGQELCNYADIFSPDDSGANPSTELCHNIGEAYRNLSISKWWAGGALVPGGWFYYHGSLQNNGNVPVWGVTITETIPADTTLVRVTAHDYNWNFIEEITPAFVAPDQYLWNVTTISNGMQIYYEMEFEIDIDAQPGTVLTNTIAVSPAPDEGDLSDNVHTEVEQIYDNGPNLRVHKQGYWSDWGPETRQIEYQINIENIGDESVDDVLLTDTYPEGLYMNSGIDGFNYWGWWNWGEDPASGVFTVAVEALSPGENLGFNVRFITDTWPLPSGMVFTNTAQVDPTDPYPDDNVAEVALATGPDLWVEKELLAGDVEPGEIITFHLAFGNQADLGVWGLQGTAWLTDTLPDGMTFLTSTLHWCEQTQWCGVNPMEVGDDLVWQLWPLSNREWNEIHLTVEITDTASSFQFYTNRVEIASDAVISDAEAYYANNVATAVVGQVYELYLPLLLKK